MKSCFWFFFRSFGSVAIFSFNLSDASWTLAAAGLRVVSYLRHVCGSRLDCGCCLCGPAQKIAASLPGSSLGCREASAASSSTNEESNVTASGPMEPLLFHRAWAGGLELPQECGNLLPPLRSFCATVAAACRGWSSQTCFPGRFLEPELPQEQTGTRAVLGLTQQRQVTPVCDWLISTFSTKYQQDPVFVRNRTSSHDNGEGQDRALCPHWVRKF